MGGVHSVLLERCAGEFEFVCVYEIFDWCGGLFEDRYIFEGWFREVWVGAMQHMMFAEVAQEVCNCSEQGYAGVGTGGGS